MKYGEFVDAVAAELGSSKAEAEKASKAVFGALGNALVSKEKLIVNGFGTFSTKDNPAKTGRNPATGEAMDIPAKTVVKFKASSNLGDRVNGK